MRLTIRYPNQAARGLVTDPPYYDAIPYLDLSDFFLVWLKRTLHDNPLLLEPVRSRQPAFSQDAAEAVQDEIKQADGRPKDRKWFEETMAKAFAEGRRVLSETASAPSSLPTKQPKAGKRWLTGMIRGGWTITGLGLSLPRGQGRPRARDSAALATSIHLICRPPSRRRPHRRLGRRPARTTAPRRRTGSSACRPKASEVPIWSAPASAPPSKFSAATAPSKPPERPHNRPARLLGKSLGGSRPRPANKCSAPPRPKRATAYPAHSKKTPRLTALFLWTLKAPPRLQENQSPAPANTGEQDDEADEEAVAKAAATGFALPST